MGISFGGDNRDIFNYYRAILPMMLRRITDSALSHQREAVSKKIGDSH